MEDLTKFNEFQSRYSCEQDCFQTLFSSKWPDGYCCSRCGHRSFSFINTRRLPLYQCLNCQYQASLISGTVMEGSRTLLHKWFQAIFLITSSAGINAVQLARLIEVTYKTAWLILHKLRHVMSCAESLIRLQDIVRVEPDVYGKPYNPTGRWHHQEHPILAGASYDNKGQLQTIRLKQVASLYLSTDAKLIIRGGYDIFVSEAVHPLATTFIVRRRTAYSSRCFSIVQLCRQASAKLNSLYRGIGTKHLQAYFDEVCFIYNNKSSFGEIINRLICLCASTVPITCKLLTSKRLPPDKNQYRPIAS